MQNILSQHDLLNTPTNFKSKFMTSSNGYRSLARRKGNKPIGSYSAKSSTICIWYPDRNKKSVDSSESSTCSPCCTLRGAEWTTRMFCTDSSQANIRSRPCPAISSCANNNFKYLRLQGPGSAHAEKDFLHIDVVNKYEQTHCHFELHIFVNQLQKALDISKQFHSTCNSACHRLLPRCSCFHRVSPSKVAQTSSTGTSAPRNATATSQLCWWSTWQTRNFLHLVRLSDLHEVLVTSSDASLKFEAFLRTSKSDIFHLCASKSYGRAPERISSTSPWRVSLDQLDAEAVWTPVWPILRTGCWWLAQNILLNKL